MDLKLKNLISNSHNILDINKFTPYQNKWDLPFICYIKDIFNITNDFISHLKKEDTSFIFYFEEINDFYFVDKKSFDELIGKDFDFYKETHILLEKNYQKKQKNKKNDNESQKHGFIFESFIFKNNLKDIIKNNFRVIHEINNISIFTPISIKSFKYKNLRKKDNFNPTDIEFGAIDRNFKTDHEFILGLVGFKQNNNNKVPCFSDIVSISPHQWNELKKDLSLDTIYKLINKFTSFTVDKHLEAKAYGKETKPKYNTQTKFDIRFKADSKGQRRIQCSLKLVDIYNVLNIEIPNQNLLNVPEIISSTRNRNKTK